jgi:REP element-mobilizing transposase RayT
MADTFTQIYIQVVFAVKSRSCIINADWENELYKYISGIVKGKGQKSIIVNGMPDHVHVFVGLNPSIAVSDLVRDVKNNSTKFLNAQNYFKNKFEWQEGFGAFSYSHSQIENVYNYILNQKEHHRKKSFREEYLDFLKTYEIKYNEKYLFEWFE